MGVGSRVVVDFQGGDGGEGGGELMEGVSTVGSGESVRDEGEGEGGPLSEWYLRLGWRTWL